MTLIECTESDGWDGISIALSNAVGGDTVLIKPGNYIGNITLTVNSGITLRAEQGAKLYYIGENSAISLDGGDIILEKLNIISDVKKFKPTEINLIFSKYSHNVVIKECVCEGNESITSGIDVRSAINVSIIKCRTSGFLGSGIVISYSSAKILENECWNNKIYGITVFSSGKDYADVILNNNKCYKNQYGISLTSTNATIKNNSCNFNECGILLTSSTAIIEDNECSKNAYSGILLQPELFNKTSNALIRKNYCQNNSAYGIALYSSNATIEANECSENLHSGILLQRSDGLRDKNVASGATIASNYCYSNGSGISLYSSNATISTNECWNNNYHGIAIDEVSNGIIANNRCHDNFECGIFLSFAKGIIETNECWRNQLSGIELLRNPSNTTIDSDIKIKHNLCYDNEIAGIRLLSSIATIEGNECWENKDCGIRLQRHPKYNDVASDAIIKANRCHDNQDCGIALSFSNATIEANECWNNRHDEPCWDPQSSVVTEISHFLYCSISDEMLQQQRRLQKPNGALINKLESQGILHAIDLADFLHVGVAVDCFSRFWLDGTTKDQEDLRRSVDDTSLKNGFKKFVLSINTSGQIDIRKSKKSIQNDLLHSFSEIDQNDLLYSFSEIVGGVNNYKGTTKIIATIGASTDSTDQLIRQISTFKNPNFEGSYQSIRDIVNYNSIRISEPVLVDYRLRSKTAINPITTHKSLFDDMLLAKQCKLKDCLRLLLIPSLFSISIFVLIVLVGTKFFDATLHSIDPVSIAQKMYDYISDYLEKQSLFNKAVAFTSLPLLFILSINLLLPSSLELRLPRVERLLKSILDLFGEKFIEGIKKAIKPHIKRLKHWNWRRWAIPHILGSTLDHDHIIIIAIKNVDSWHEEDLKYLRDIISSRHYAQGLLLLLHMTDRSMIPSALLHALYQRKKDSEGKFQWEKAFSFEDAAIVDFNDIMNPNNLEATSDNVIDYHAILGDRSEDLLATLLHSNWSFYDLLPTLVLGSTPKAQMTFQYQRTKAFEQYKKELRTHLQPYFQLCHENEHFPEIEKSTEIEVFAASKRAQGILHIEESEGIDIFIRWIGRCGYRYQLASSLLSAMGNDCHQIKQCHKYLYKLLSCGELFHLTRFIQHIQTFQQKPILMENIFVVLSWHIESARFLAVERLYFAQKLGVNVQHDHLQEKLMWHWLEVKNVLVEDIFSDKKLPESEWNGAEQLFSAYLDALQTLSDMSLLEEPSPLSMTLLMEDLRAAINVSEHVDNDTPYTSIQNVFTNQIRSTISKLRYIDCEYADELLAQKFAQDWFLLPPAFKTEIKTAVFTGGRKNLCEHLLSAKDPEVIMTIIKNHRYQPAIVISQLSAIATRYIKSKWHGDYQTICTHLAQIGLVINAAKQATKDIKTRLPDKIAVPIFSPIHDGKSVFDFFQNDALCRQMMDCFNENKNSGYSELVGFAYGAFSGLNDVIEELVEVKFFQET